MDTKEEMWQKRRISKRSTLSGGSDSTNMKKKQLINSDVTTSKKEGSMGRTKRSRIYTWLMRTLTFKVGENVTSLSDHWGGELMETPLRRRGLSQTAPMPSPPEANAGTRDLGLDGEAGVSFAHPGLPWP